MTLKNDGFNCIACGITSRSASKPATDHFYLSERCGGGKNPERGVFEIAAGDEPLPRFVHRWQDMYCGAEEFQLRIAVADLREPPERSAIGRIVMGRAAALSQGTSA